MSTDWVAASMRTETPGSEPSATGSSVSVTGPFSPNARSSDGRILTMPSSPDKNSPILPTANPLIRTSSSSTVSAARTGPIEANKAMPMIAHRGTRPALDRRKVEAISN